MKTCKNIRQILKIIPFMFPEHATSIPRTDENCDDFFTHLSPVLGGRHPSFLRFESSGRDMVPWESGNTHTKPVREFSVR